MRPSISVRWDMMGLGGRQKESEDEKGEGGDEVHLGLMLGPKEGSKPTAATPNSALDAASTTSACT